MDGINPDDSDATHVGRTAYDVFFVFQRPSLAKGFPPKCPRSDNKQDRAEQSWDGISGWQAIGVTGGDLLKANLLPLFQEKRGLSCGSNTHSLQLSWL